MVLLYLFQKTQNHQVVSKVLNHVSSRHTMGGNHKYTTRHTLNNTYCSISFKWRAKTGKPRLRRTSTFWIIVFQWSVVRNHKHCCKFGVGHVSSLQGTAVSRSQHHRGDSHGSLAYFATKLYLEVMCSKFIFLPQGSFNVPWASGGVTLSESRKICIQFLNNTRKKA